MWEPKIFQLPDGTTAQAIVVIDSETGASTSGGSSGGSGSSDAITREAARTQNVLTEIADSIWATKITSFTLLERYIIATAHNGLAVKDQVLKIARYTVNAPDPAFPDQLWTSFDSAQWIKIFDATTNSDVRTILGAAIDTTLATLDESGVVYQTSSSRTVKRRALDASLNESTVTATETRTVQASHIYPYQTIFDSGWV